VCGQHLRQPVVVPARRRRPTVSTVSGSMSVGVRHRRLLPPHVTSPRRRRAVTTTPSTPPCPPRLTPYTPCPPPRLVPTLRTISTCHVIKKLASRDESATSGDDSGFSREVSWRSVTLPLSLQRSNTTLGAGRPAASVSVVDGLSGQNHADLIRDYRRYRQLQAGITDETTAWRGAGRVLARPTVAPGGSAATQPGSAVTSPSPASGSTDAVTTTVFPLPLGVAGPLPLQRSVGNVVSARRVPADFAARRTQAGYPASQAGYPASRPPSSTFDNSAPPSDTSDLTGQLHLVPQVHPSL